VRYREALAGSYNLAAVHLLERVGLERLMDRLRQAGLGALEMAPREYGLQLALGSAKVRLTDLAAAYGFLARQGRITRPRAILSVRSHDGKDWTPPPAPDTRLFSAEVAWQVMDILSDPEARRPMFGPELPVDLPFRVAAKTGTSRGFADTVAIGVTQELTVAAWAGNFSGQPSYGVQAMAGAAPLLRDGLLIASDGRRLTLPPRPDSLTPQTVCPLSGQRPGPHCPHRKQEHVAAHQELDTPCTWHRFDPATGRVTVVYPFEIRHWRRRPRLAAAD
jgi:penicillin-binding protein 1C